MSHTVALGDMHGQITPSNSTAVNPESRSTHPHIYTAGAVVRPPEDLRHILQHIQDGQQITAVTGPITGRHSQLGHHIRDSISHKAALRFGQMFPCLREKWKGNSFSQLNISLLMVTAWGTKCCFDES